MKPAYTMNESDYRWVNAQIRKNRIIEKIGRWIEKIIF
jgi:hypothetical protein